jgi:rare lipoprotein A
MRGNYMQSRETGRKARARAAGAACNGHLRALVRLVAVAAVALTAANCSTQRKLGWNRSAESKTRVVHGPGRYDPRYGVYASPRLVAPGQPVPKGGGRELVGRPYRVGGRLYVPDDNANYMREGIASWYGAAFHGRVTANGELFDRHAIAAAHPTMPLPSYARVTNLTNGLSLVVRVNDRGPYHGRRVIDVSERVADVLGFRGRGTAPVRVEYLGRASVHGSDDDQLLATFEQASRPMLPGMTTSFMSPLQTFGRAEPDFDPEPPAGERSRPSRPVTPITEAVFAPAAYRPPAMAASYAPVPPQRPLDLGTIPDAARPVPAVVKPVAVLPPARPREASLFFAAPELPPARLSRDDPFKDMKPQRFITLKLDRDGDRPLISAR